MSDPFEGFEAVLDAYIGRAIAPLRKTIDDQAREIATLKGAREHDDLDRRLAALESRKPPVNGKDGAPGAPGERGPAGDRGADGKDGAPGRDGANGKDGAPGERGADGVNGKDGAAGERGRDGVDGKDGAPGERGERGDPGKDGQPGRDGAAGKDGAPGVDGVHGKDGRDGVSFLSALVDADGELVITASDGTTRKAGIVRGRDGKDGADGSDGAPGAAGRDAVAIRPVLNIEDAKTYPEGTWAIHAGGSWYAEKATEPLRGRNPTEAGWTPIAVGEAKFDLAVSDDLRTITTTRTTSTGLTVERRYSIPVLIDRGVYSADREYSRGDAVTRSGSLFIARADSPKGLPGASDDWRLAVKAQR